YNSTWLKKLGFKEISELMESFSLQQMSNRRNFKDRIEKNEEISLRELMYPLMQGYDSVAVKADIELGGFDQLFNLKAGRTVQKHYGMPEQDVLTVQMLEGTDGRKMSTSWGNIITIVDEPNDMFGKIMSVNDNLIEKYFLLCTDEVPDIKYIKNNPKDSKMQLAYEITQIYHGEKKAEYAKEDWIKKFEKKEIPEDILEIHNSVSLLDTLIDAKLVESKGAGRRLLESGAITDMTEDKKLNSKDEFKKEHVYKIGKHKFIKIK
ncbi:MAG: tyrosine--tRNA ligase, partial [bacterium]|nr:tyrosine--tRNA ligase [bacterium]